MYLPLPSPFTARYVRIYPMEWNLQPCMRVEFYGCQEGGINVSFGNHAYYV